MIEKYLHEMAENAINAFESDQPNWRLLWSEMLDELSDSLMSRSSQLPSDAGERSMAAQHALRMIAAMFQDLQLGAASPLAKPAPIRGRPSGDTANRTKRFYFAMAAAAGFSLHRSQGWTQKQLFRRIASDVSRYAPCRVTWNEVRSAWTNRHRLSLDQIRRVKEISTLMDAPIAVRGRSAEGIYDEMCNIAGWSLSSKLPIF